MCFLCFKDALGFYLAEDVFATEPFPSFPASVKDGYAVIGMLWLFFRILYMCFFFGFHPLRMTTTSSSTLKVSFAVAEEANA